MEPPSCYGAADGILASPAAAGTGTGAASRSGLSSHPPIARFNPPGRLRIRLHCTLRTAPARYPCYWHLTQWCRRHPNAPALTNLVSSSATHIAYLVQNRARWPTTSEKIGSLPQKWGYNATHEQKRHLQNLKTGCTRKSSGALEASGSSSGFQPDGVQLGEGRGVASPWVRDRKSVV